MLEKSCGRSALKSIFIIDFLLDIIIMLQRVYIAICLILVSFANINLNKQQLLFTTLLFCDRSQLLYIL
jgi:hypothetical protein